MQKFNLTSSSISTLIVTIYYALISNYRFFQSIGLSIYTLECGNV